MTQLASQEPSYISVGSLTNCVILSVWPTQRQIFTECPLCTLAAAHNAIHITESTPCYRSQTPTYFNVELPWEWNSWSHLILTFPQINSLWCSKHIKVTSHEHLLSPVNLTVCSTLSLFRLTINSQFSALLKGLRPVLEGLVVTMHQCMCQQEVSILRPLGQGIGRTVHMCPSALLQQNPTDRS